MRRFRKPVIDQVVVLLFLISSLCLLANGDEWMARAQKVKEPATAGKLEKPTQTQKIVAGKITLNEPFEMGVPPSANIYDGYKFGEASLELKTYSYLVANAKEIVVRFKDFRNLLVALKMSERTLGAFDRYATCVTSLPLSSPIEQWNAEQQRKWKTDSCGWYAILDSCYLDYSNDSPFSYFHSLGYEGLNFAWYIPKCINDDGQKIEELKKEIQWGVRDSVWLRDHYFAKSLTPEVLSAVKSIAAMDSKLAPDPLSEGITSQDISKMADAAKVIRDAYNDRKLIQISH